MQAHYCHALSGHHTDVQGGRGSCLASCVHSHFRWGVHPEIWVRTWPSPLQLGTPQRVPGSFGMLIPTSKGVGLEVLIRFYQSFFSHLQKGAFFDCSLKYETGPPLSELGSAWELGWAGEGSQEIPPDTHHDFGGTCVLAFHSQLRISQYVDSPLRES